MAGRAVLSSFTAPPPPPPGVQVEGAARELPGEEEGAPEGYTAAIDAWEVVEEEVFENERWNIQGGWGRRYLLGWDRPAWSSRQGQPRSKASAKLPEGWEWSDPDWTVDTAGLDANGWAYGLCWEGVGRRRQGLPHHVHFTRWRRWVRRRQRPAKSTKQSCAVIPHVPSQAGLQQLAQGSPHHTALDVMWGGFIPHHLPSAHTGQTAQGGWGLAAAYPAPPRPSDTTPPANAGATLQHLLHMSANAEDCGEPDYLCCTVLGEVLTTPLVCLTSGHTYEGSVLHSMMAEGRGCPMTRKPMTHADVVPNYTLALALRMWRQYMQLTLRGGGEMCPPPSCDPPVPPAPYEEDWLLVVPVSRPGMAQQFAAPYAAAALTTVSAEATAPPADTGAEGQLPQVAPSEGEPGEAPRKRSMQGVGDGLRQAVAASTPPFLVCPLSCTPRPDAMRDPVITLAGWTYEREHLLAHFEALSAACEEGVPLASFTDPITGMALPRAAPFCVNVALRDTCNHWRSRKQWVQHMLQSVSAMVPEQ